MIVIVNLCLLLQPEYSAAQSSLIDLKKSPVVGSKNTKQFILKQKSVDIDENMPKICLSQKRDAYCPAVINAPGKKNIATRWNIYESYNTNDNARVKYCTLFGGDANEAVRCVYKIDDERYLIIGNTGSSDLPITDDAFDKVIDFDSTNRYSREGYLAILNTRRAELEYGTYFGGSDQEVVWGVKRDEYGNIIIGGTTWSNDLPTTSNAAQKHYAGNGDGYIIVFSPNGKELLYCSYLGGSGVENLRGIGIASDGKIYAVGLTDSDNFPITGKVVQTRYGGGGDDVFVSIIDTDHSALVASTFLGGSSYDEGYNIKLLPNEDIIVCGFTSSSDYHTTEDALYRTDQPLDDGFITILSSDLEQIKYSTYIGWKYYDQAQDVALGLNGMIYVLGHTTSTNLPVSGNAYQKTKGEHPEVNEYSSDYYIIAYSMISNRIEHCTYLGSKGNDNEPRQIEVLPNGNVAVAAYGQIVDYPYTDVFTLARPGDLSFFFAILTEDLASQVFAPLYSGSWVDVLYGFTLYQQEIILYGATLSADFLLTDDAFQSKDMYGSDGVILEYDVNRNLVTSMTIPYQSDYKYSVIYPNPTRDLVSIRWDEVAVKPTRIMIYDEIGRNVYNNEIPAGMHSIVWNSKSVKPGLYIIRLTHKNGIETGKVMVR